MDVKKLKKSGLTSLTLTSLYTFLVHLEVISRTSRTKAAYGVPDKYAPFESFQAAIEFSWVIFLFVWFMLYVFWSYFSGTENGFSKDSQPPPD